MTDKPRGPVRKVGASPTIARNVRLPAELWEAIDALSRAHVRSANGEIEFALRQYLAAHRKKAGKTL